MHESFGGGYIAQSEVTTHLEAGEGEVVLKIARVPKSGHGELILAYGFFYLGANGKYYDILQAHHGGLKTLTDAQRAVQFILVLSPLIDHVDVPILKETNVIEPGSLR